VEYDGKSGGTSSCCPASAVCQTPYHPSTRTSETNGHQQIHDSGAAFDQKRSRGELTTSATGNPDRRHWRDQASIARQWGRAKPDGIAAKAVAHASVPGNDQGRTPLI